MAINPELITTIRVDQLPDETLSLTNLFPHTVGTDLKSATIQELVDLVATAIGVSGGVGYVAISVTDGQQLPDVPELPSFFLCGAGTFLNINGYPDVICTDELNAVMSLTDHWQLAVGIPIVAEVGVQSVTGSAVDNTDPLNPIINATGTPTLQEVTNEGNTISSELSIITLGGAEESVNVRNPTVPEIFSSVVSEGFSSGRLNKITQYTCEHIGYFDSSTRKNIKIYYPTSIVGTNKIQTFQDADGTIALTSDITTPTLQEVLDEGDAVVDSAIFLSNTANDFETSVNEFGDGQIVLKSVVNDTLTNIGAGQVYLGTIDGSDNAIINKDGIIVNAVNYAFPSGASSPLATLADIPTGGGGIPHATASGTDTYTATITGVAAYTDADAFLIRFTNGNTTGATLNINSLGAKTLYRNNDGALIGGDIINGGEMLCIYNTSLNGFQVIGTAPNSLFAYVTNDDSVTITKGMPVYAFSGTGDRMTVKRAYNTSDATSAQTVGLVLSTSIAANQKGLIMMQGLLDGLSILPTSTWADGDAVYLGATPGSITNVKPFAPNHLVYLGVVTTASNGAAGRMYVRVQNGYELQELHNVQAQSPSLNDTLWYDNTVSPAQWKTASIPTILGYTPANIASPTFTGTVTTPAIIVSSETASRVAIIDGSKNVKSADTATYPSLTELSYGKGVTSAIQTQLNARCQKLYNLTSQITHTGTTAKTLLLTYFIPANTFTNGDFFIFSSSLCWLF